EEDADVEQDLHERWSDRHMGDERQSPGAYDPDVRRVRNVVAEAVRDEVDRMAGRGDHLGGTAHGHWGAARAVERLGSDPKKPHSSSLRRRPALGTMSGHWSFPVW